MSICSKHQTQEPNCDTCSTTLEQGMLPPQESYDIIECKRCGFKQYANHAVCPLCNTNLTWRAPYELPHLYDTWRLEQYLARHGINVIRIYTAEDCRTRQVLPEGVVDEDKFHANVLHSLLLDYKKTRIYLHSCSIKDNMLRFKL